MKILYFVFLCAVFTLGSVADATELRAYDENNTKGDVTALDFYYEQALSGRALSFVGSCQIDVNGDTLNIVLIDGEADFTNGVLYVIRNHNKSPSITEVADITIKKGDIDDVLLETNGGTETYKKMLKFYNIAIANPIYAIPRTEDARKSITQKLSKPSFCR